MAYRRCLASNPTGTWLDGNAAIPAALSAALLGAAGKGQVIPQAATLLSVVSAGSPVGQLRSAAAELFSVGATSGHDLCAGIAGVLASFAELAPSDTTTELATTTRRQQ